MHSIRMYENGLLLGVVFATPKTVIFGGNAENPKKCTVGVYFEGLLTRNAILAKNDQKAGQLSGHFWTL